jgi:hypothetical protein
VASANADLAVSGLHDMLKRIRDDETVLVPHKTLLGLIAALDIVLAAYADAAPQAATAGAPALRLVPAAKRRGGK